MMTASEICAVPVSTNFDEIFDFEPDPWEQAIELHPGMYVGWWTICDFSTEFPPRVRHVVAECACGTKKYVQKNNLLRGRSTSCSECNRGRIKPYGMSDNLRQ